jgi:hypothetical protein
MFGNLAPKFTMATQFPGRKKNQARSVGLPIGIFVLVMWVALSSCTPSTPAFESRELISSPESPLFLPIINNFSPPLETESIYMKTVDSNTLAVMGCGLGIRDAELPGSQDSFIILAFGNPHSDGGIILAWVMTSGLIYG